MNRQLEALNALYFGTAPTADEVWTSLSAYHVGSLHSEVSRRLASSMNAVSRDQVPVAAVVQGPRGSGKTHLLGWTRQEIQSRGGFFFYIKLVTGSDFWESATGSLVDSLYRKDEGGQDQLLRLLDELSHQGGLDDGTRAAIVGERELTRADVDAFVRGIRTLDRQVGNLAADTARALVLIASSGDAVEIGTSYLGQNDDKLGQRAAWGFSSARARQAQLVLRDLTRLFALVGPLLFAFDQFDNLVAVSETESRRRSVDIAAGLMELREETRRTFMVIACLPETWEKIERTAMRSALDRFDVLPTLGPIPDEATAAAIVSSRFRPGYESARFTPPTPTWPIGAAALAEAPHRYTARRLLDRVAAHIEKCLETGEAVELTSLETEKQQAASVVEATPAAGDPDAFTELFNRHRDEADDIGPLDKATEDRLMPALLGAGLRSLLREIGADPTWFDVQTDFGGKIPALHAMLRFVPEESSGQDVQWSFRAIATDNASAAQNRIHKAVRVAELEKGLSSRRLMLLRNTNYPRGETMRKVKDDAVDRGASLLTIGAADLRTFTALGKMLDHHSPGLEAWLRRHRPAASTEVFSAVVAELGHYLGTHASDGPAELDGAETTATAVDAVAPEITIGTTVRGNNAFTVAVSQLRQHTVVVGAAGSGKTVLIKRIVEQCALRGVPAIVLDPNDDLGRLGDPWPSAPDGWTDEQGSEARRYFAETEVVVWTPGLSRGRPLSFHPLPDFDPVLEDLDDFTRLLRSTVATLAPHAGIRGRTSRATKQLSVLQRVLERYVRGGGRTLAGFVELLAEPPEDIVNSRTSRLAVEMADTLEAAMTTDPLFGESGAPADPGVLLTPSPGKATRVSVVSFVGLSGDGPAHFVSRLQASLFSWFRAHPVSEPRLGGLLVMDEAQNFVPSGGANPSTDSTVDLIRQIRKYGLGMVLASQAPKGINHEALGNTANQFLGRLTAPAQIEAAKDMAQSRNTVIDDFGKLTRGTFYAAGEGTSFRKVQAPICLSHHAQPLHEDEIVERARRA